MMSDNKSWRNFELVLYPENTSDEVIAKGCEKLQKWAWILHDKDEGRERHIHLYGQCKTPMKTGTICNAFGGIRPNQINKILGTWNDAIAYLTHANRPDKYQYDPTEVHSNYNWKEDADKAKGNKKLQDIVDRIGTGEIRAYNLTEHVTTQEYVKWRRQIDGAFKWRDSYVMAHLEELVEMKDVVWIYGPTGTGKTTFAKKLARQHKFIYAITSLGQHMFDEYKDEPCLIIDDLRPDDLKFTTLLGILDPYNFKAANARYRNKPLQTQLVIVTTTMDPIEFWSRMSDSTQEDRRQLLRRINTVIAMTKEEIVECSYDEKTWTMTIDNRYPNFVLGEIQRGAHKSKTSQLLGDMAQQYVLGGA